MSLAPESVVESNGSSSNHGAAALFDVESYIARYPVGSETRLQRLAFLSQNFPHLQQTCLKLLEQQVKQAGNVVRYIQVFAPSDEDTDEWVRSTTANNEATLQVLEARLSAAQANLNKDAIRISYLNLGEFLLKTGHLREALKHVLRARDYCTNRSQTALICLQVMELAMHTGNYSQVRDYAAKAEHAIPAGDADFPRFLKVAAGMALLGEGQYKEACQKFCSLQIPPETTSLCSPEDVALYCTVLALATMTRSQLVEYMQDYPGMLELVPSCAQAMRDYLVANYKACLDTLETTCCLEYDVLLAPHVATLLETIRKRAYVDYLQPYTNVSLPVMAQTFGQTLATLERHLCDLIGKGEIRNARINCRTQTLTSVPPHDRLAQTQLRVGRLQESVMRDAYAATIRLACIEHEPALSERGQFGAVFGSGNPEDELAGVDDGDSDEDVDMIMYDQQMAAAHGEQQAANPEDAY